MTSQTPKTNFRDWIQSDGSTQFLAEPNRYHLYVAYTCPFASRAIMVRALKGLEDVISMDVCDYDLVDRSLGWPLIAKFPGTTGDSVNGARYLKDIYMKADRRYCGKFSVPVLWDKKLGTIVSNESADILRMLNSEFNRFAKNPGLDLYPDRIRSRIDDLNLWISQQINEGVYKTGFAESQEVYEKNVVFLFDGLDKVENILSRNRYLCGNDFTEADIRLFTTLIRFDSVYYLLFKCSKKHIYEYPNMWDYLKGIYQSANVAKTVNWEHIIKGYFLTMKQLNPQDIIPIGPKLEDYGLNSYSNRKFHVSASIPN